jgi:hypothetical protein
VSPLAFAKYYQASKERVERHNYENSNNAYRRGLGTNKFSFQGVVFEGSVSQVFLGLITEYAVSRFLFSFGCSKPDTTFKREGDQGVDLICLDHFIDVKSRFPSSRGWRIKRVRKGRLQSLGSHIYVFCSLKDPGVLVNGYMEKEDVQYSAFQMSKYDCETFNIRIDDTQLKSSKELISYFEVIDLLR